MNLRSANLPRLHTYEQAIKHYQDVVPFRHGREKGRKPLGNRRYTYLQIERVEETGAILLQMYNSDVVAFFPNGEVHVSLCGYDTIGTRQFIFAATPYSVERVRGTSYLVTKEGHYAFPSDDSTLKVMDHEVLNPTQQLIHRLDRKAFAKVKEPYRGFMEYVKNMGSVLSGIEDIEIANNIGTKDDLLHARVILPTARAWYYHGVAQPRTTIADFLYHTEKATAEDNLEQYYKLFLALGISALFYNGYLKTYISFAGRDANIGPCMLDYFCEMLKHHYREEVFVKQEVPIGKKVSNVNQKYFNY